MSNEFLRSDPHALNGLEFRIDAFSVPAGSRDRFEALMRRNVAFIETLPGFLHHTVFEKTQGAPPCSSMMRESLRARPVKPFSATLPMTPRQWSSSSTEVVSTGRLSVLRGWNMEC